MKARELVKTTKKGRIVIPKEVREEIGLSSEGGDLLHIKSKGDSLVLRPVNGVSVKGSDSIEELES